MATPGKKPAPGEYQKAGSLLFFDQRLIDSLSVAIYTCDAQGYITMFNQAAVDLWGREPKIGQDRWCGTWRMLNSDETPLSLDNCPMAVALKESHPVIGGEFIAVRPDGTRRYIQPHPSPIYDASGALIGAVNLLIDVTESRTSHAASAVYESLGQTKTAVRGRDDFFSILSHELRTPLTPALIALEGMEVDPMLPEGLRRNIAMVRRNLELESRMIDDLLDLGQLARRELKLLIEPVALNEALRDVCDICRPQVLEKKLRLEVRLDPGAGQVMADSARLQQVMWNLLKSAIKFTPPLGTVIARTFQPRSGVAGFEIIDSGAAIMPDGRRHTADPPANVPHSRRVFGDHLGLEITRSLIDQQHGTFRVESGGTAGGAMLTVELHAASDAFAISRTAAAGHDRSPSKRLLLVEDHHDTATALSRHLELSGFVVRSVPGFLEALDLLQRETFDLVISDIGLAEYSGHDLMKEIRRHWSLRGIAISGYGSELDILESGKAGFSAHLVKPLKLGLLLETIHGLLDKAAAPPAQIVRSEPAAPVDETTLPAAASAHSLPQNNPDRPNLNQAGTDFASQPGDKRA